MNEQRRADQLKELEEMQYELEQLSFPPLYPADPSRESEVWEERVARKHRLGAWIRHAERLLEEEKETS